MDGYCLRTSRVSLDFQKEVIKLEAKRLPVLKVIDITATYCQKSPYLLLDYLKAF